MEAEQLKISSFVAVCNSVLCDDCYLQKFRHLYDKEKESQGVPSAEIQFAYAWCLVRSRQTSDLRLGTQLLEGNPVTKDFLIKMKLLLDRHVANFGYYLNNSTLLLRVILTALV